MLGGIVAPIDEWGSFCRRWQAVLNKYNARLFHFREWATASAIARKIREPESNFSKNPYCGWTSQALDAFLLELATIAGDGNKLIVGGAVYTDLFHKAKISGDVPINADPYEHCIDQYFISVEGTISIQRAPWKRQPVSFFFDWTEDEKWQHAIMGRFNYFKKKHSTFKELTFAHKEHHLPLQAADMIAYRGRQITEKWVDGDRREWPELDSALYKSTFAFLETHKAEVLTAYLRGELEYEYSQRTRDAI